MKYNTIIHYSDNGYTGRLYGKSSLTVHDETGKECFHTGRRSIDTYHELKEFVDTFPEFLASYRDPCAVCPCYEISGDICTLAVQGMQCKYIEVNKVVNDLMEERDAKYKRTQINDSTATQKNRME